MTGPVDLVVVDEGWVLLLHPAAWARKISLGKTVKATGSVTVGGVLPAASTWARAASQYKRAAEAPVPSASTA